MLTSEQALKHLLYPASSRPNTKDQAAVIQAGAGGSDDRVITFEQFEELIDKCQTVFTDKNLQPGDKIMLSAPNCAELGAAIIASLRLGLVVVPVDFRISASEIANVAKQLGAKLIVSTGNKLKDLSACENGTECGAEKLDFADLKNQVKVDFEKKCEENIDLKKPAIIILTSGTTGTPKGAVHDLGTMIKNMIELAELVDINDTKKVLLPLPLSHVFGFEVFNIFIAYGGHAIFTDSAPTSFFQCLAKYKPEILVGVPTLYAALLNMDPKTVGLDNAQVLLCGGAPMPLSLAEDFEKKFGKRLNNGYGSTESKIVALNLDGPHESVGKLIPSCKVEIVNDKDEVMPDGETGQIRLTGSCNMQGYLNNEKGTSEVLHGDSYYTGDLGRIENGYLFISGRSKEMIVVAGNKVFPAEVEDALRKNSVVKEVAVYGLPHKQLGQIVKATVVVADEQLSKQLEGSQEEVKAARAELISNLKEYCKQNLKRELRPMDWDFLPSSKGLPKTTTGKVDKKQLVSA